MAACVKICGLTEPLGVEAAVRSGAAYVGFVFFKRSPRNIDPERAARLAEPARARGAQSVAVLVDPTNEDLDALLTRFRPDHLQLHGAETPERVADVERRSGVSTIKAVPVAEAVDVQQAVRDYAGAATRLMFDAKAPAGAELPGGNGSSFDWALLQGLRLDRPWFLAGGLDRWNVAEAARISGAPALDVSSGVERGAGIKDPALITAFLDAVREA